MEKTNRDSGLRICPVMCKKISWEESEVLYFNSMKEASRMTGVSFQSICNACHGIAKSAGGYLWRFSGRKPLPVDYSRKGRKPSAKSAPKAAPKREYRTHKTDCMPKPYVFASQNV